MHGNPDRPDVPDRLLCARCAAELRPGAGNFYRVTIEAVADPWPPTLTEENLDLCGRCYRRWIENPTGREA